MLAKVNLFKAIEWGVYVGLWAISFFVVKEVWDQWLTKETGIKQSEDKIEEPPTTTICFKNRTESWFVLHLNGDLKFLIDNGNGLTELNEGANEIVQRKVSLVTLFTWWAGICYKIAIDDLDNDMPIGGSIKIWYNDSVTQGRSVEFEIHFTSEINSYGIITNNWMYGDHLTIDLMEGTTKQVSLKAIKEKLLKSDGKCIDTTHYACFISLINSGMCPRNCVPFQKNLAFMKNISIPNCNYPLFDSTSSCYTDLFETHAWSYCTKSCNTLQYEGVVVYESKDYKKTEIQFWVKPSVMKVHEEYLLYNTIGMIGSIGGTLGLFVGFSFFNVALFVIESMQKLIEKKNEIDVNNLTPNQLDQVRNEFRKMFAAKQHLVSSEFTKVDGDF